MNLTNVLDLRIGDQIIYGTVVNVINQDGQAILTTNNGVFVLPLGAGMQVFQ